MSKTRPIERKTIESMAPKSPRGWFRPLVGPLPELSIDANMSKFHQRIQNTMQPSLLYAVDEAVERGANVEAPRMNICKPSEDADTH